MNDAGGALFTTAFFSTDTIDKFVFRFHYSDNTAGGWSKTVQGTPAPFAKTISSATLTPALSLGLSSDHATAIPGDSITYTATVSNTGATLTLAGDLYAAATGSARAMVASYWDDIYLSLDGSNWTMLAGAAATATGYVPAVSPPGASGLALSPASVTAAGVSYASSGDPILGTTIDSHDIAQWHYTASVVVTPSLAAALSDPTWVTKIRNSFHLEVTPANPNVIQPAIVNLDVSGPLYGGGASAMTNLTVTILPPAGAAPLQFTSTNTSSLASLAVGASTSVSGLFTVQPPAAKASGQSDASYFAALSSVDGALLIRASCLGSIRSPG